MCGIHLPPTLQQRLCCLMPSPWCGQVLHSRCSCKCFPSVGHTQKHLPSSFFTRLGVKLFPWELPPDFCPSKEGRDLVTTTVSARAVCDGVGTLAPGQAVWGGHRMSPWPPRGSRDMQEGVGHWLGLWQRPWLAESHQGLRGTELLGHRPALESAAFGFGRLGNAAQSLHSPHPSAPQLPILDRTRFCASHFSRGSALSSVLPDFLGKGAKEESCLLLGVCILRWRLLGSSFFLLFFPHYQNLLLGTLLQFSLQSQPFCCFPLLPQTLRFSLMSVSLVTSYLCISFQPRWGLRASVFLLVNSCC